MWCGVSYNERKSTNDRSLHASRTRVFLHGFLQPIRVFPRLVHSYQRRKRIHVSTLQRRSAGNVPNYVGVLQLLALTTNKQKGNPRQGLNILDRGFSLAKRLAIPPTNSSAILWYHSIQDINLSICWESSNQHYVSYLSVIEENTTAHLSLLVCGGISLSLINQPNRLSNGYTVNYLPVCSKSTT